MFKFVASKKPGDERGTSPLKSTHMVTQCSPYGCGLGRGLNRTIPTIPKNNLPCPSSTLGLFRRTRPWFHRWFGSSSLRRAGLSLTWFRLRFVPKNSPLVSPLVWFQFAPKSWPFHHLVPVISTPKSCPFLHPNYLATYPKVCFDEASIRIVVVVLRQDLRFPFELC